MTAIDHPDLNAAAETARAPRSQLRVQLIGTLDLRSAAGPVALPRGRKARALLALLALASPEPVRRDRITSLLWSQREKEQARASLRQSVHELQVSLGQFVPSLVVAERGHIALRGPAIVIDVHAPGEAIALPRRLLEDLDGIDPALDRFLVDERLRFLATEVRRGEAVMAAQDTPAGRLAAAENLLIVDPSHEGAWRALMQARSDRGEPAAVVEAYDRCVAAIATAKAVPPSRETQTLLADLRERTIVPPPRPASTTPRREGARVGVMPLRLLGSADDAGLSLGLADEITTALARFRWLFLIASPSLAAVVDATNARPTAPARAFNLAELDLDFLLDGTVQRSSAPAGLVRINLRLLDMRAATPEGSGEVVWTGRFERSSDDLLTLQDAIAAEAAAQIDPELQLREGRRAGLRPASSASAYELVLRSIPALYQLEERGFRAAGEALGRAVALDPDYAAAHAWWAYWHLFLVGQGWSEARDAAMARAEELAERAVRLDPSDARALTIAGHVRAFLHRRIPEALGLHDRALALNPNLPLAWVFSGLAHSYAGRHREAIQRIGEARRLSPFDPNASFFDMSLMIPHLLLGAFDTVVELGQRASAINPTLSSTYKALLSALGHLGRHADAEAARAQLLRLDPGFTLSAASTRTTLLLEADNALYLDGLRLAGLPP